MSEPELAQPDEAQWRADTLLMHSELIELELHKVRREMLQDPALVKLQVGAGQPVEQTITGNQQDPYNGVAVFNPTPVTLSLGFQAGSGILAPIVVPPWSWLRTPQRYVNLSVAVLNPNDQQVAVTNPVIIERLRVPPSPAADQLQPLQPQQPFQSLNGASAAGGGLALDNMWPRAQHSLIVVASAGVSAGSVQLNFSNDGANWLPQGALVSPTGPGVYGTNNTFTARWVRATITAAITGGTVTATVASV